MTRGSKNAAGIRRKKTHGPIHNCTLNNYRFPFTTTITHIPLSTHAPTLDASRKTHVAVHISPSLTLSLSLFLPYSFSLFLALRNVVVALRIERGPMQYSNEIPAYIHLETILPIVSSLRGDGPILESRVCINRRRIGGRDKMLIRIRIVCGYDPIYDAIRHLYATLGNLFVLRVQNIRSQRNIHMYIYIYIE